MARDGAVVVKGNLVKDINTVVEEIGGAGTGGKTEELSVLEAAVLSVLQSSKETKCRAVYRSLMDRKTELFGGVSRKQYGAKTVSCRLVANHSSKCHTILTAVSLHSYCLSISQPDCPWGSLSVH